MLRPSTLSPLLGGLALAPILALGACADEPAQTYDPDEVIATAITFATELERLDNGPLPSIHVDMLGFAEFYANDVAADVFRSIVPGSSDTVTFPRGSILVKNNLDQNGEPRGALTILAKFEEGYFPMGNDWFFAMVSMDGEVLNNTVGNGVEVYACYDCHAQRAPNSDLIIGLSADELR